MVNPTGAQAQPSATAPTVSIQLDGRPYAVPAGSTLADLVAALGHAPEAIATALDGSFIARGARADHVLAPGAQVLLFQPIVGG